MTDPAGRVLYVGKARRLRTRLQSYFRARYPETKAARILHATQQITWDYMPSEFAACLGELRQILRHRPPFNVHMNRARNLVFIAIRGGEASRLVVVNATTRRAERCYGPLSSPQKARDAVSVLNDLLGLRDCGERVPVVFPGQEDLFAQPRRAACMRHELGTCSGPCAGFIEAEAYQRRVDAALSFLEGRAIAPLDRVVHEMMARADAGDFEAAIRWRTRFEALEWLFAALNRARSAVEVLTFVYRDPGEFGDDRAYLIRRGLVRATYPWPATPIECEAFRAVVRADLERPLSPTGPLPAGSVDEVLLLLSWFRRHPGALRRTEPLERWT
jgi:excinuclease UvrABC nuclease subunit